MADVDPLWLGVAATAGTIGKFLWDKFVSREGRTYDTLVAQLGERIASQEGRLTSLETGLDQEREARRGAETEVFNLRMRVQRLESELRLHGIEVPPA